MQISNVESTFDSDKFQAKIHTFKNKNFDNRQQNLFFFFSEIIYFSKSFVLRISSTFKLNCIIALISI